MKNKKILTTIIGLTMIVGVTGCGDNGSGDNTKTPDNPIVEPDKDSEKNPPIDDREDKKDDDQSDVETEEMKISKGKAAALSKLDEVIYPVLAKIDDEDLRDAIQAYYNTEKQYINSIVDLTTAQNALQKTVDDTKQFVKNVLRPLAINKLNSVINPLIGNITHDELKASVSNFYSTEIAKISAVETLDTIADTFKEILEDTKKFIKDETEKVIIALKNAAIQELDPYVTTLIGKIPFETLKTDTQSFYTTEKNKLTGVNTIDGVAPCVTEIKQDLIDYSLSEAKKIAVSKLQEVVDAGLAKIPNPSLKNDLTAFSTQEIAKLNAISSIDNISSTLTTVVAETNEHIKSLLVSTVKDYLTRLTSIETATGYDYLPAAMSPTYENNLITESDINYDFETSTQVSSINQAGFGEQWQMVVENLNQSVAMAKVFNVAQTALNAAGVLVDAYITNSYADEMAYAFSGSGFTGNFSFKDSILAFNISLTSDVTVPGFGSVRPVIRMEYDLTKEAKGMFISLGDAYKVKYVISDNVYEMATTYGLTIAGKSASRSSYLSINKNNNKTVGHIYEYTTYEGSDKIKSCADFYVENGFVSVVGNKSSGMLGFDGYINELYSAGEGKMIGYEVRETLSAKTYNTLWFNLWDISGINKIKVTDKTSANKSSKSTVDVYINDSTNLLSPTYNVLVVKTSRKYDVELRNRYYYTYDSENDRYVSHKVEIPMFFIQEGENYESFVEDILKDNGITASVSLSSAYLNKIISDYHSLIDIFIQNKDAMSSEAIIEYLGNYE